MRSPSSPAFEAELRESAGSVDEMPELPEAIEHEGRDGLDGDGEADATHATEPSGFGVVAGSKLGIGRCRIAKRGFAEVAEIAVGPAGGWNQDQLRTVESSG